MYICIYMINFSCLCMLIHDYNLQRIWKSHQNYHHLKLLLMNSILIWLWNFFILIYHPQKIHNEKFMDQGEIICELICFKHLLT
jgi:hypothetical protein